MKAFIWLAIAAFACSCATAKESAPSAQAQSAAMAQAKGGATGAAPGAAQTSDQNGATNGKASARPEGSSPTTAAEAAEQLHQEWVRAHGGQSGAGAAAGNASQRK